MFGLSSGSSFSNPWASVGTMNQGYSSLYGGGFGGLSSFGGGSYSPYTADGVFNPFGASFGGGFNPYGAQQDPFASLFGLIQPSFGGVMSGGFGGSFPSVNLGGFPSPVSGGLPIGGGAANVDQLNQFLSDRGLTPSAYSTAEDKIAKATALGFGSAPPPPPEPSPTAVLAASVPPQNMDQLNQFLSGIGLTPSAYPTYEDKLAKAVALGFQGA